MIFNGEAKKGGTVGDVFPFDGTGEGLIFHLLLYAGDFYVVDGLRRLHQSTGSQNPASSSEAKSALSRWDSRGVPE